MICVQIIRSLSTTVLCCKCAFCHMKQISWEVYDFFSLHPYHYPGSFKSQCFQIYDNSYSSHLLLSSPCLLTTQLLMFVPYTLATVSSLLSQKLYSHPTFIYSIHESYLHTPKSKQNYDTNISWFFWNMENISLNNILRKYPLRVHRMKAWFLVWQCWEVVQPLKGRAQREVPWVTGGVSLRRD